MSTLYIKLSFQNLHENIKFSNAKHLTSSQNGFRRFGGKIKMCDGEGELPEIGETSSIKSCSCSDSEPEDEQDPDICIVEGSDVDKSVSISTDGMPKTVWSKVRPPPNLGCYQPAVSARQTEIIRAQLTRKTGQDLPQAPSKVYCKCEPNISKMNI